MKQISTWVRNNWSFTLVVAVSLLALLAVSFYNLSSITNSHLSTPEVASIQNSDSGKKILNNPLQAPYKVGQYVVIKHFDSSVYLLRSVTVIFGIIFVLLFYSLLQRWFSPRIAYITTAMLASSSFYLNYARVAVPDIMLPLALLGLLWTAWWLYENRAPSWLTLFVIAAFGAALYIPGIIWFMILAVFAHRSKIKKLSSRAPAYIMASAFVLLAIMSIPLLRAFYLDHSLIFTWLAVPQKFVVSEFVRNLIFVPASLTVRSLPNPVFNLGRLPLLDIATLAFSVLGVYAYGAHLKLVRTKVLAGAIIIAWLMIALDNSVSIIMLLPLINLTVAGGILLLLQQWYFVFPKNPVARNIGVTLLCIVISISIFYNFNRYFIAWANNPLSQAAFDQKIPPNLLQ